MFIILLLFLNSLIGQKEDYIWLFGSDALDNIDSCAVKDTINGATNFDFNFDPPLIYYDPNRIWDIRTTNASICDLNGKLEFYTNGQVLYNGNHEIIEDTINYNAQWDNWNIIYQGIVINDGLPNIQGAIILPQPGLENLFYIFYSSYNLDLLRTDKMNYAVLEKNNNEYNLLVRDVPIVENELLSSGNMNAVKHGNGRDWWLIFSKRDHSQFYKYLLTNDGVKYFGEQSIGSSFDSASSQLFFSSKGNKLALFSLDKLGEDGGELLISDFDRCTGEIYNPIQDRIEVTSLSQGVSFSQNGQFLYATDSDNIYQYDLDSPDILESKTTVATYDGYIYYYPFDTLFVTPLSTEFGWMALAPDGKIYVSTTTGSSRRFHRINNPNIQGIDCDVQQHAIVVPTSIGRGVPNFPNFRLGPLDGSGCDSLGIDNYPVAKFRYDQDSLEDLKVHFFDLSYFDPIDYLWEFGDGNSSNQKEPIHIYEETGVYEVCLTVSNDFDNHTSCKSIIIGVTNLEDVQDLQISLFPNPTTGYLNVSFHNYFPIQASVVLYDALGKIVSQFPLTSRTNIVHLYNISSGIFIYKIIDENVVLKSGKIFKI